MFFTLITIIRSEIKSEKPKKPCGYIHIHVLDCQVDMHGNSQLSTQCNNICGFVLYICIVDIYERCMILVCIVAKSL